MRVLYEVPPYLSQAMFRLRRELVAAAPQEVQIVDDPREADVQILDSIGLTALGHIRIPRFVLLQHCYVTAGAPRRAWLAFFRRAALVVSYYDLPTLTGASDFPFLRQPLGVSAAFGPAAAAATKTFGIVTSGYVASYPGEAIGECYEAARACGKRTCHIGPAEPQGMGPTDPAFWTARSGLTDDELARCYGASEYVSGLRWREGFELPVIEGAACGARPICFDLPSYRHWFDGVAVFVPHARGDALVRVLRRVLDAARRPVTIAEQAEIRQRFDWPTIAACFWARVLERQRVAA